MYLADYHTHTQFSPDAQDSMTAMAQAAIRAGLDEICFTDHVEPMEWGSTKLRAPYDWSLLTRDFRAAQAAVGDQIQLRLGIELGMRMGAGTRGGTAGRRPGIRLRHRLHSPAVKKIQR